MAQFEKTGFLSIGYLENRTTYAAEIREYTGENVNYDTLGRYVDEEWRNRYSRCLCWNDKLQEVDGSSRDIVYMMVDTGYVSAADGSRIYGGFTARAPGPLELSAGWKGVRVGTREDILDEWRQRFASLESYTAMRDYQNIGRVLGAMTGQNLSANDWKAELQRTFEQAQESDRLYVYTAEGRNAISYFRLGMKDTAGEEIWLYMNQNTNPSQGRDWFGLIAVSESELLDYILDLSCYHLGMMYFEGPAEAAVFLQRLADMAMEENWTAAAEGSVPLGILRSYITHTLYRLLDQDSDSPAGAPRRLDEVGGRYYFNSGLLNRLFRQIIIVGDKKELKLDIPGFGEHVYHMIGSLSPYSENDREIASIYDGEVYKIPPIATYFTDYKEVTFNAHLAIRLNDIHIFEDGVERKRLPKYDEEYQRCRNNPAAKDALLARIARDFDSAILRAKLMAERNYKLAVPQFWRETGEIQFLLPIYLGELEEAGKPQCALALALDSTGRVPYYRGATILTLDMAYNNARLIAKPDVFWLNSSVY